MSFSASCGSLLGEGQQRIGIENFILSRWGAQGFFRRSALVYALFTTSGDVKTSSTNIRVPSPSFSSQPRLLN
jgi:hypothetical protein